MSESLESMIEGWDGLGVVSSYHAATGSWIFVALHDDTLGRPTGGCRLKQYDSPAAALWDAMRLAEGMTWKWAAMDFHYGGGAMAFGLMENGVGDSDELIRRVRSIGGTLAGIFRDADARGTTSVDSAHALALKALGRT